jgi:hypothetical protein
LKNKGISEFLLEFGTKVFCDCDATDKAGEPPSTLPTEAQRFGRPMRWAAGVICARSAKLQNKSLSPIDIT